jgi:hypothetical protein
VPVVIAVLPVHLLVAMEPKNNLRVDMAVNLPGAMAAVKWLLKEAMAVALAVNQLVVMVVNHPEAMVPVNRLLKAVTEDNLLVVTVVAPAVRKVDMVVNHQVAMEVHQNNPLAVMVVQKKSPLPPEVIKLIPFTTNPQITS